MMAGAHAEWLEGMRRARVLEVASALGLTVGSTNGNPWISPCPACQQKRRNAKPTAMREPARGEKRGAIVPVDGGAGWWCSFCHAGGDALRLVELHEGGRPWAELGESDRARVREWCGGFLGLDTSSPGAIAVSQARKAAKVARVAELEPAPSAAPVYPPAEELAALWAACVPVTDDAEASAYLSGRGIDPVRVAELDAARALPLEGADLPPWARVWRSRRLRVVLPLVDFRGVPRSVLARTVVPSAELPEGTLKSMAPKGYGRAGLVLACPFARRVLELGAKPSWWADDAPTLRVIVAEGEVDFLAWCAEASDANEHAPAVLGVTSGSWTAELAARIPDGAVVVVATDDDKGGDRYATKILETLAPRMRVGLVRVERWRPRA